MADNANKKKRSRPRRATFSHVIPVEPHGSSPEEMRRGSSMIPASVQEQRPEQQQDPQQHQSGNTPHRGSYYERISGDNTGLGGDQEYYSSHHRGERGGSVSSVDTADLMDHRRPSAFTAADYNRTRAKSVATSSGSQNQQQPQQPHQAGTGHEFSARRLLANNSNNNKKFNDYHFDQPRSQSDALPGDSNHHRVERWVRRRSSLSNMPLLSPRQTDPNEHGNNNNMEYSTITDGVNGADSFAITMDEEDSPYGGGSGGGNNFLTDEEEIPRSNPSSRRSSDTSSLDDVCFPLDSPRELDSSTGESKMWPDLAILSEFAEQEMKESGSFGVASDMDGFESSGYYQAHIEHETDLEGRLRPHRIVPWAKNVKDKKNKQQSQYPQWKGSAQLRFTYFREDMDTTIHSPSISGLLQSGQSFADLFPPRYPNSVQPGRATRSQSGNGLEDLGMEISQPPARGATPVSGLPGNTSESQPPSRARTPAGTNAPNSRNESPVDKKKSRVPLQPTRSFSASNLASGQQQQPPTAAGTPTNSTTEQAPFWLNVMDPSEEEMKIISKTFGIHPLTTEDIFLGESREKIELFRNYYLVCFTSIDMNWEREKTKARERERAKSVYKSSSNSKLRQGANGYTEVSQNENLRRRKNSTNSTNSSNKEKRKRHRSKARSSDLKPLNMYILVFHEGVITFHFSPTPHPINVRRRARLLRDYITVSSDWISYALIDDVTDGFAPMIEAIEDEVNSIEDEILKMHSGHSDDDESDDDDDSYSSSSSSSSSSGSTTKLWNKKGDMLRRIGECRKRVMSLLRLLGSKADVIKGFSKRCNEMWDVAPKSEIGLYLGDIQDHIVTMVQSLNHYEKLLARSHSNYLAQINIDMTRVNNDMNDVLGRITVLGTIVLPMNIVTGLWGMNVLVPGQDIPTLWWFWGITGGLLFFAFIFFMICRKVYKLV